MNEPKLKPAGPAVIVSLCAIAAAAFIAIQLYWLIFH